MGEYKIADGQTITTREGLIFKRDGNQIHYHGHCRGGHDRPLRSLAIMPGGTNRLLTTTYEIEISEKDGQVFISVTDIEKVYNRMIKEKS